MNRKDLIGKIATDARLTRAQASLALNACLEGIRAGLMNGDRVTISGFGTFGISHRKARKVKSPNGGTEIEIEAKRVPRFAPGADLRSAIQNGGQSESTVSDDGLPFALRE